MEKKLHSRDVAGTPFTCLQDCLMELLDKSFMLILVSALWPNKLSNSRLK